MTPEQAAQVEELFEAACEVPVDERAAFLESRCEDETVRREVESLLGFDAPDTIIERPSQGLSRPRTLRIAVQGASATVRTGALLARLLGGRGRRLAGLLLLVSSLTALAMWTHFSVQRSLQEDVENDLQAVLEADVVALGIWIEERVREAEVWAADPRVRDVVERLVEIGLDGRAAADTLRESDELSRFVELVTPSLKGRELASAGVIDRTGMLVGITDVPELVGMGSSATAFGFLVKAFDGDSVFVRPHRDGEFNRDEGKMPGLLQDQPVVGVVVPVRGSNDQVVAALAFTDAAAGRFTQILRASRLGKTGETYAFDGRATLLSEVRESTEQGDSHAMLNLRIVEPLPRKAPGGGEQAERRPTRLARAVLRSRLGGEDAPLHGVEMEPYVNFRGAKVVGAWRWLPDYGFAVVTEIEAAEAYGPLDYVRTMMTILFACLVAVVAWSVYSSFTLVRLRSQVGEARRVGPYTLVRKIGEGGMGEVYLATHAMLKRPTAVKMLKRDQVTDEGLVRFEREVQLAAHLTHPNTIEIYDYGRTQDGTFYYAMEYLEGITLSALVRRGGAVPPGRVVHIVGQVCESLREAHEAGLVHRDIKPLNIMICPRGGRYDVVKVLDFGLVKQVERAHTLELTGPARISGTPMYMAPERIRDARLADARVDIYSVGAVMYFLLTGRTVFESSGDLDLLYKVVNTEPAAPSTLSPGPVPARLDALVLSCLAKAPEARPDGVGAVLEGLYSLEDVEPWDQEQAREWWTRNAGTLGGRTPKDAPAAPAASIASSAGEVSAPRG